MAAVTRRSEGLISPAKGGDQGDASPDSGRLWAPRVPSLPQWLPRFASFVLAGSLVARPGAETKSQSQIRPRAGAIQEAVFRVLVEAGRPLRALQVHTAAQELAGIPLSWNTVKDCLHKHARRPGSPVERVGHGCYRHR